MADWGFEAIIEYLRSLGASDEVISYLANFTDEQDLAARLQQLGLPPTETDDIYNNLLSYETDYTKQVRKQYGGQLEEYQKQLGRVEQNRQMEQARAAPYEAQQLSDIYNNPYITKEDMAHYRDLPIDQFTKTMSAIADQRAREAGEMTRAEKITDMSKAGPGYRGESEAFLRAFNPPMPQSVDRTPPLPSVEPAIEEFKKGIGYGEGTRLRSYLESQIGETVRGTQGAREKWRERMHPEEVRSYEDVLGSLQSNAALYGRLSETAPTGSVVGGSAYGAGGPAEVARRALEVTRQHIARLDPTSFETQGIVQEEEDPLKQALRNLQAGYKSKYYRQPGTGISQRLAPSVRFR